MAPNQINNLRNLAEYYWNDGKKKEIHNRDQFESFTKKVLLKNKTVLNFKSSKKIFKTVQVILILNLVRVQKVIKRSYEQKNSIQLN